MIHLTDEQLINLLESRFADNYRLMTELKQVNTRLQESETLKSQFLSNIRNEINNPFTSILGLSISILKLTASDIEKIHRLAGLIHTEAFRLDYQLSNIFMAADLEAGAYFPVFQEANPRELAEIQMKRFHHQTEEKKVRVILNSVPDQDLPFITDHHVLNIILANLLSNAIEYSPSGGEVRITLSRKENRLGLSVKDRGKGIPKAIQEKLFDRFWQADQGMTRQHQGHGLGLSVVKSLTDLLEGIISVKSNKRIGTCFTVWLPEKPSTGSLLAEDGILF